MKLNIKLGFKSDFNPRPFIGRAHEAEHQARVQEGFQPERFYPDPGRHGADRPLFPQAEVRPHRQHARGRHRPSGQPPHPRRRRTGGERVPHRLDAPGEDHPRAHHQFPGHQRGAAARAAQHQAGLCRAQGVLRHLAAVAVHGPDQRPGRDHPQAAHFGPRPRRPEPRTGRLRSARRPFLALRPHLPHRNPGRPEHRPDLLPDHLCPRERIRVHRNAVPQGGERPGGRLPARRIRRRFQVRLPRHRSRARGQGRGHPPGKGREKTAHAQLPPLLPDRLGGRGVHHRPGQRRAGRQGPPGRQEDRRPQGGRRDPAGRPPGSQFHGHLAQADRLHFGGADPLPGERRRQPRPDGLQHAAPGRAADQSPGGDRRHRHGAQADQGLGHGRSSAGAPAW